MENHNIQSTRPPDNNLVWAILSTLLCCLPTGIYAIIKAAEVNSKWYAGDYDGARESAEAAKKWSIYGAVAGVIGIFLYIIIVFLAAAVSN